MLGANISLLNSVTKPHTSVARLFFSAPTEWKCRVLTKRLFLLPRFLFYSCCQVGNCSESEAPKCLATICRWPSKMALSMSHDRHENSSSGDNKAVAKANNLLLLSLLTAVTGLCLDVRTHTNTHFFSDPNSKKAAAASDQHE